MTDLSSVWPEWTIEKKLGSGSYGTVYKAVRNDFVKAEAAIKVISVPKSDDDLDSLRSEGLDDIQSRTYYREIVNGFVQEIELLLKLRGLQNIVSVEDYKVIERTDEVGWDIYIRMELLTSLKSWLADKRFEDGSLTEDDIVKLGADICNALEICRKNGIIHRDIKPENILVNENGDFKLADFGVARRLENASNSLSVQGAWPFMAPEVALHKQYDERVDIYSLGLVLYQLLNKNKLPFLDTNKVINSPVERQHALSKRLGGESIPEPYFGSSSLKKVVLTACAYDPDRRFSSASEMRKALSGAEPWPPPWLKWAVITLLAVAFMAICAAAYKREDLPVASPAEDSSESAYAEINIQESVELFVGDVVTVPVRFKGDNIHGIDPWIADYEVATIIDKPTEWQTGDQYSVSHIRISGNSAGETTLTFYLLNDEKTNKSIDIKVMESPISEDPGLNASESQAGNIPIEDAEIPEDTGVHFGITIPPDASGNSESLAKSDTERHFFEITIPSEFNAGGE